MARALWKGSISFGLVNIPVELHTAVRDSRPKFRMLHAKDKSPVKFERVCIRDGHPVAWADLVKGYEYQKGRFVVVTKEDFQSAALEKTRTVDIVDFVEAEEIDDRYFETPYYVTPAKGGERAYALLREAIRESGRVGIAKFILGVRKTELDMAKALVNSLAAEWDPAKYTDQYRENLMRTIKAKVQGKHVDLEPGAEPRQAEVVDLMERLRRSLEQSGGARETKARRASAKKPPARKRARDAA